MDLEKVTAEIRPRSHWEAADLGCALVRQNFGTLVLHWCVIVVPIQLLIFSLLGGSQGWAFTLVWFLKPLYDRVPLFFLSRFLFGQRLGLKDIVKEAPKLLTRRIFWALTLGRFSPSRSFTMPVSELEGLRGKAYSQRVRLLARHGDGVSFQTMIVCLKLEFLLGISVAVFFYGMMPEMMRPEEWGWLVDMISGERQLTLGSYWIAAGLYMASMLVMELFYVGAGFGLYVNSRTITEGWDIELAFKRLRERVRSVGTKSAALVAGLLLVFSHGAEAVSEESATEAIQQVLAHEDFEVKTKIVQVPVEKPKTDNWWTRFWERVFGGGSSGSSSSSSWNWGEVDFLALLGRMLFWFAVVALVAWLGYVIYKNRQVFFGHRFETNFQDEGPKTRTVVGLDVTPESLPADLLSAARAAWDSGDPHLAMSLLYRGAISRLVEYEGIEIEESDTEYDCVRRVNQAGELHHASYFKGLTNGWVQMAYGERIPAEATMSELFREWPFNAGGKGGAV